MDCCKDSESCGLFFEMILSFEVDKVKEKREKVFVV